MAKKIGGVIYWAPRLLSLAFALFLMVFSLDVFDMNLGFWGTALGLLMHNIPAFFLLAIAIISWKREIVGGIAFSLVGMLYLARTLMTVLMNPPIQWHMLSWSLPISGPAFLVGILFFANWRKKRR